jgi:ribosome-associated protein
MDEALAEARETQIRASGPGGQHVNKTSTAIELRFDLETSAALPPPVRQRLAVLAGSRLNGRGELILVSERHRSQELNRRDARERLLELLIEAAKIPKRRRPTRPPRAASAERLARKTRRGQVKSLRGRPTDEA